MSYIWFRPWPGGPTILSEKNVLVASGGALRFDRWELGDEGSTWWSRGGFRIFLSTTFGNWMSTVDTPNKNSPYFGRRSYSHIFYINAHQFERYLVYLLNFEGGGNVLYFFFLGKDIWIMDLSKIRTLEVIFISRSCWDFQRGAGFAARFKWQYLPSLPQCL